MATLTRPGPEASVRDLRNKGKDLRSTLDRSAHADLSLPERDPVEILSAQNENRLSDLVPVRIGRMMQSPFAYYRGSAAVMAHDLAPAAVTGPRVMCCGDAHISNFGLFASPERRLLFDLNDFDEASTAPWEWDVKRLAASVVIGGRDIGMSDSGCRDAAARTVAVYRDSLRRLYSITALERYFFQIETEKLAELVAAKRRRLITRATKTARSRTSDRVLDKLVTADRDGRQTIKENPPIAQHVEYVHIDNLRGLFDQYAWSMRPDAALLLSQFRLVDFILRVVGVGSVGTRCYVLLLEGPAGEPLFLQAKEAPPSVLQSHGRQPFRLANHRTPRSQGERVVSGQRILQAQSDPFLGWVKLWNHGDSAPIDFYVRQFRDMKGSVELSRLGAAEFRDYSALCGAVLARAHSQSTGGATIRGYLGQSDQFDTAIAHWAMQYADQAERDFTDLQTAVRQGKLPAEHGV